MRKTYTIYSSDLIGSDFKIVDRDGNQVENLVEVTVRAERGEPVRAEITVMGVALNVQAEVDEVTFVCPNCEAYVSHDCEPNTLGGGT